MKTRNNNTFVEQFVEYYEKPLPKLLEAKLISLNKEYGNDPSFDFKRAQYIFVAKQRYVIGFDSNAQPVTDVKIVGFAILNRPHGYWYFRNCIVDKIYRGGVQDALIKARLDFVRKKGGEKVSVGVFPKNYHSLNNLIANGFKFKGIVKHPKIGEYQLLVNHL